MGKRNKFGKTKEKVKKKAKRQGYFRKTECGNCGVLIQNLTDYFPRHSSCMVA